MRSGGAGVNLQASSVGSKFWVPQKGQEASWVQEARCG